MDFLNVLLTIEINCPLSLNSKFAFTLLENIVIADYRKNRSFVRQMIRKWNLFFPLGKCISFLFVLSKILVINSSFCHADYQEKFTKVSGDRM